MLEVLVEDRRWADVGLQDLAEQSVRAVLVQQGLDLNADLCVMGCSDARIADLNAEFREKRHATNVLSWPSQERVAEVSGARPPSPSPDPFGEIELGAIDLAYETCAAEAQSAAIPFADHIRHLIVHGVLHLLGYDHINPADGDLMEAIETEILASIGVPNPY